MPRPLPGMVSVAEYGSRFDADVASARLFDCGIDNAILGDPAYSVAPHHVTEPGFNLLVSTAALDDARAILEVGLVHPSAEELDQQFYQRRFADRPRWVRGMTWTLVLAIPVPLVIATVWVVLALLARAFP